VTDLRTLAQAVVDASEMYHGERSASVGRDRAVIADCYTRLRDAGEALGHALGCDAPEWVARAILAALNAERAQGYARAMREVVAHAEATALGRRVAIQNGMVTGKRVPGGRALHDGANNALHAVADWARERLPAAAEKEHGG
jgi:hypothetical protein